jgi:O-antigen ligase
MRKFIGAIIILILSLEVDLFYIVQNTTFAKYNSGGQKIIIIYIALFVLYLMLLITRKKDKFIFNKFIIFFIVLGGIEFIRSIVQYNQTFRNVFIVGNYFAIVLCYYIFTYYIKSSKHKNFLQVVTMIFTLILSCEFIVQFLLFKSKGIFLNIPTLLKGTSLRITASEGLINIGIIIAFSYFFSKNNKHKLLSAFTLIAGMADLIFVQKTRAALLIVVISCIILTAIKYIKKPIKLVAICTIIAIIFGIFTMSSFSSSDAGSIYSFSTDDASYIIRQQEVNFYTNQIQQNPILGMGFLNSDSNAMTHYLATGINDMFYRSDVGLIGFTDTFGLVGALWYILLLIAVYKKIRVSIKDKDFNNYEVIGIFVFIIFSSSTLIVMDVQRIIGLIILLSLVDLTYFKHKCLNINNNTTEHHTDVIYKKRKRLRIVWRKSL